MVLTLNLTAQQAFRLLPPTPTGQRVTADPSRPAEATRVENFVSQASDALSLHWTPSAVAKTYDDTLDKRLENLSAHDHLNSTTGLLDNASHPPLAMGINEDLRKAEIGVSAAILYLALFGNGIVLLVLRLRRQKLTRMQWFIAHLAIADIFVAFFNVLPQLIWDIVGTFHGNDLLCKGVTYFQLVAMYASSWVLVMAAVDRYVSICHPLTSQTLTPKRVHLMISLAWTLSLVFSLPQFFIFSYEDPNGDGYTCHAQFVEGWGVQAYVTWVFLADYGIPFLILAFCYGRICHVVWISVGAKENKVVYRSVRNGVSEIENKPFRFRISFHSTASQSGAALLAGGRSSQSRKGTASSCSISGSTGQLVNPTASESKKPRAYQRGVSRSKLKTIKLTLTVVLCYLLCWAPFFFVQMYTVYGGEMHLEHPAVVLLMLMASLNSCTNPWIYLAFSGCKCPGKQNKRRASRSWGLSTHLTSAADSHDNHHSPAGPRSSAMSTGSGSQALFYHHGNNSHRGTRRSNYSHY